MDFGDILKRAWHISWQNKSLWVLGFFAGASGGFGGWGGSGYRYDVSSSRTFSTTELTRALDDVGVFFHDWGAVLIAGAVLAFLIAIAFAAVSLAAQGGLVQEVDTAANGGAASSREGWRAGFHLWGRLALVSLILLGPLFLLVIALVAVVIVGMIVAVFGTGDILSSLLWIGLVVLILVPMVLVAGFVLTTLYQLGLRYAVIEQRPATSAVQESWRLLRSRFKDVVLMWILMIAIGIGFGVVIGIPAGALGLGTTLAGVYGVWPISVGLGLALAALSIVVGAFYGTFVSAAWTVFFRALTGRGVVASAAAYLPPQPASMPPMPPTPPGPPA